MWTEIVSETIKKARAKAAPGEQARIDHLVKKVQRGSEFALEALREIANR